MKPQITFKTMFWTFQPKKNIEPNGIIPFITWDWQDEEIDQINWFMLNGGKVQRRKSREIGMTWLILGCALNLWLFTPEVIGLITSRKEEIVDKKGNPDTLFWKLDFLLEKMPEWIMPEYFRSERHLENKWNGNVIDGEATVENVSRGGRRTWSFSDEFQAVKFDDAKSMDRSLSDTAACRIFLGTSEYRNHPFSVIGRSRGVNAKFLGWWLHPYKARGLYWSPDINEVVIEDIDYYKELAPEVFNKYQKGEKIKYSDLETEIVYKYPQLKISFIADGGVADKPKWRSPWYDNEEITRDPLDTATNLDGNEIGAGDSVFTPMILQRMKDEHGKKPTEGNIIFEISGDNISKVKFLGGRGKFKWWGEICGTRPPQNHNYVIGCDISLGQGRSNSTCSVFDVDERRKVGSWCDSHTLPEQFAEIVFAIGKWVGGVSGMPYLNFEANGIGQVFSKRIREIGYGFVYRTTTEKKGFHQRLATIGWVNSRNTLLELLMNYNASLTACFRTGMSEQKFINHDSESLDEAQDYIFDNGRIVLSSCMEDSGGAKAAHGDRVIADALCCLAAREQSKATQSFAAKIVGTREWITKKIKEEEEEKKNKMKILSDY